MPGRRGVAAVVALALLLAGCGIEPDSAPRDITPDEQDGSGDVGGADGDAQEGSGTRVYLIDAGAPGQAAVLRAVGRDVRPTPTEALLALLDGPSDGEQEQRLSTAIPEGTVLHSARFSPRPTLVVDLSERIFEATGDVLVDAVAQVVFTASELEDVERVELLVEGKRNEWPRGDGTLVGEPLTVFDFPGRAASTQPDFPAVLPGNSD